MKKKTAYKLAIDAIAMEQKKYYPGHCEFVRSKGLFRWAETEHIKWTRLQTAKEILISEMQGDIQMEFGAIPPLDRDAREGAE
jgi:hypothetical protein